MKYKATNDIDLTALGKLKSGSVVKDISTNPTNLTFKLSDGSEITVSKQDYIKSLVSVPEETPENVIFEKSVVVEALDGGIKTFGKSVQVGSGVGALLGLGVGFYRKSGVSGYIGYAVLFSILGGIIGGYMGGKKALKNINK